MASHVYHDGLPGFSPTHVLHPGCPECELRAGLLGRLSHDGRAPGSSLPWWYKLDRGNFARLWAAAVDPKATFGEFSDLDRMVIDDMQKAATVLMRQRMIGEQLPEAVEAWVDDIRSDAQAMKELAAEYQRSLGEVQQRLDKAEADADLIVREALAEARNIQVEARDDARQIMEASDKFANDLAKSKVALLQLSQAVKDAAEAGDVVAVADATDELIALLDQL
jgi:vacuolar-type H+-ATPase subunit H